MSFWFFFCLRSIYEVLIIDLFLNCILESFFELYGKKLNCKNFRLLGYTPAFSIVDSYKFLKIYYSYIDTIHKYILNIYIHNCVSLSYPIVVLFTILRHHTCINIELVSHDVIATVSNYRMIKSSLRDIGLHDVEPDHNSRTIRLTVRKNFKVMICGVYKIPCIFITVYIAPRFQKCAHLHTIAWKLQ